MLADHYEGRGKMEPEEAVENAQDVIVVIAHHLGAQCLPAYG